MLDGVGPALHPWHMLGQPGAAAAAQPQMAAPAVVQPQRWLEPLTKEAMLVPKQLMTESMVSPQRLETEKLAVLLQEARCTLVAPLALSLIHI